MASFCLQSIHCYHSSFLLLSQPTVDPCGFFSGMHGLGTSWTWMFFLCCSQPWLIPTVTLSKMKYCVKHILEILAWSSTTPDLLSWSGFSCSQGFMKFSLCFSLVINKDLCNTKTKPPPLSLLDYSSFAKLTGSMYSQRNFFLSGWLLAYGISSCLQANKKKIASIGEILAMWRARCLRERKGEGSKRKQRQPWKVKGTEGSHLFSGQLHFWSWDVPLGVGLTEFPNPLEVRSILTHWATLKSKGHQAVEVGQHCTGSVENPRICSDHYIQHLTTAFKFSSAECLSMRVSQWYLQLNVMLCLFISHSGASSLFPADGCSAVLPGSLYNAYLL